MQIFTDPPLLVTVLRLLFKARPRVTQWTLMAISGPHPELAEKLDGLGDSTKTLPFQPIKRYSDGGRCEPEFCLGKPGGGSVISVQ
jgi:hypothetical protein